MNAAVWFLLGLLITAPLADNCVAHQSSVFTYLPALISGTTSEVDFNTALVFPDIRRAYGETRYIALCYLDRRLHVLRFAETGTGIRVISFRKANAREANRYGKPQTLD